MKKSELVPCPTCRRDMHAERKACHECERTYTRTELSIAIYESYVAAKSTTESVAGAARIVLAKLNGREPE